MRKELDIFSIDQVILSSWKDSNVVTLSSANENQKYGLIDTCGDFSEMLTSRTKRTSLESRI